MNRISPSKLVRLGALSAFLVALALAIYLGALRGSGVLPGRPFALSFLAIAFLFALGELLEVPIESRGEAHSLTFTEIAYVIGLALAVPADLILARMLGGAVVLVMVRRQSAPKLMVNVAMFAAESAVVSVVFRLVLGDSSPPELRAWLAFGLGMLAQHALGVVVVSAGITILSGWPGAKLVRQVSAFGAMVTLANTCAGLAIVTSIWQRSTVGVLFLIFALLVFVLYRAYAGLTERHKNLSALHDFTRALGGSDLGQLEANVVLGAKEILRAERGALLLPAVRAGVPATRLIAVGDSVHRTEISADELADDLAMLLPAHAGRMFVPGEPLPGWLGEIGVKDAVIVPLSTDGETLGAMVVANRLTEVSSFVEDDLRLFQTLASHANVALANGRLVATLKHESQEKAFQALHDPVTGLPNRRMLLERLERAIAGARNADLGVGLIFVDLDTFKEVTDTLGTATADRLLVEMRDRIEEHLPETAQLARFTGDQFAILVTGVLEPASVISLAEGVLAEFDSPFTSDEVSLVLGAVIGIALYPDHASSAELLLQRADAATYRARHQSSGIELYEAETDPYAPRRLALAADLREALERHDVDVYVQPKISLLDERVVGAEALVRWTHPRLGPLSPDQFIPAAEHTGVIRQLTSYVVRGALAQCRTWRDAGNDLGVAVNLSGRSLFDNRLVDDIRDAIEEAGVPASSLTLELTESTVMAGSHRAMAVLHGLQDLGVGLSVDDFGTGYSSLTHLRSLPITELKIDKSFVMAMTVNDQDAVIVQALIELGRRLGLRTVAEGVESRDAQVLLREFGCDEAQGYLFSRPVPAAQFMLWLGRQRVRRLAANVEVVAFDRDARRAAGQDNASS